MNTIIVTSPYPAASRSGLVRFKEGIAGMLFKTAIRVVALILAIAASGVLFAPPAQAADQVGACFVSGGVTIPVSLAYLQAMDAQGGWVTLSSIKLTQPNGCVVYTMWGSYKTYNIRVAVVGVTPNGQGLFGGSSSLYAVGNQPGAYYLGAANVFVAYPPSSDGWTGLTSGWEMGRGVTPTQNASSMVTMWSARLNQEMARLGSSARGSVLCPDPNDCDGDGRPAGRDIDDMNRFA